MPSAFMVTKTGGQNDCRFCSPRRKRVWGIIGKQKTTISATSLGQHGGSGDHAALMVTKTGARSALGFHHRRRVGLGNNGLRRQVNKKWETVIKIVFWGSTF